MRHAAANQANNLLNKNDDSKYQHAIKAVGDSFSRLSITPTLTQNQSYDP